MTLTHCSNLRDKFIFVTDDKNNQFQELNHHVLIHFLSINLKINLKEHVIENFKKHLKTKKILLTNRQPKKLIYYRLFIIFI